MNETVRVYADIPRDAWEAYQRAETSMDAIAPTWRVATNKHKDMMTRREVLERWTFVEYKAWKSPGMSGYSLEAHILRSVLGAEGVHKRDLAHELALMIEKREPVE